MQPSYAPVLSPETLDGRGVLVKWVPPSDERPHRAPDGPDAGRRWNYWIRIGSETVDAEAAGRLEALIEQTTRVPWDDPVARQARIEDLREAKVREHLHDVRSALRDEPDAASIYRKMRLTAPVNDHEAPRNVGLLFFSDSPEQWFPGAVQSPGTSDSDGRLSYSARMGMARLGAHPKVTCWQLSRTHCACCRESLDLRKSWNDSGKGRTDGATAPREADAMVAAGDRKRRRGHRGCSAIRFGSRHSGHSPIFSIN